MRRPILYSFRRCPYAMRARLALSAGGCTVELREVLLRDKPAAMINASPKATVPVLVLPNSDVQDESRDIMDWVQNRSAPWPEPDAADHALVDATDGPFKTALDRYKYATRYQDACPKTEREICALWIDTSLEPRLSNGTPWLGGAAMGYADAAILPFIRQFALTDRGWFDSRVGAGVVAWLDRFLGSEAFAAVMRKYPPWQPDTTGPLFPPPAA